MLSRHQYLALESSNSCNLWKTSNSCNLWTISNSCNLWKSSNSCNLKKKSSHCCNLREKFKQWSPLAIYEAAWYLPSSDCERTQTLAPSSNRDPTWDIWWWKLRWKWWITKMIDDEKIWWNIDMIKTSNVIEICASLGQALYFKIPEFVDSWKNGATPGSFRKLPTNLYEDWIMIWGGWWFYVDWIMIWGGWWWWTNEYGDGLSNQK